MRKRFFEELEALRTQRAAQSDEAGHIATGTLQALHDTEAYWIAGDRKYGEDEAIIGGFGRFHGESICVIGHEKGATTESRLRHNFGMARPEGYRKAARLMEMADRFAIPVIALVDTAGAYPGIGAEERGQAEAIARSTEACLTLGVPNVAVILGEGGSGIVHKFPLFSAEEEIYAIGGIVTDITERKKEESARRFSEERYRVLVETANDAVLSADETGSILFACIAR